jgi:hypothetical protein
MLPNCKVAFKRNRKYFRGELIDDKIIKPKQYAHLTDIPKFEKYVTLRFYIKKSKSNINHDQIIKDLNIDGILYLKIDEIPVEPTARKSNRGRPPRDITEKVYKVDKLDGSDKKILSKPIPDGLTIKAWEKEWFRIKNPLCLDCAKKCKQSARVEIIVCPKYTKRG